MGLIRDDHLIRSMDLDEATPDLFGTFVCSKYAIPLIAKSGGGSVINMSSNVALMALPGRDCYTAAKGSSPI